MEIISKSYLSLSKIGAAAMAATVSALRTDPGRQGGKTFNLVLCPAHVAEKWTREIAETLPDTVGVVVRSNAELDRLYTQFQQGKQSVYAIISKEIARDGYMKRPAVRWNRRRGAFTCPSCNAGIETPVSEDGVHYGVRAKSPFFRTETARNHKCAACGELLWTAVDPHRQSDWVKIGGYGWVFRSLAWEHMEKTRNAAVRERLREIQQDPYANYPTVGASRRYPMSSYIKRRYKGRVNGLIVDELHQYNNDSGQGDAMAELAATAKKVIGMTATLSCESESGASSGALEVVVLSGSPSGTFWYNPRMLMECLKAQSGTMLLEAAQNGALIMKTDELTCVQLAVRAPHSTGKEAACSRKRAEDQTEAA